MVDAKVAKNFWHVTDGGTQEFYRQRLFGDVVQAIQFALVLSPVQQNICYLRHKIGTYGSQQGTQEARKQHCSMPLNYNLSAWITNIILLQLAKDEYYKVFIGFPRVSF